MTSFGHGMPLAPALASHDADGIINDTNAFLRPRNQNDVQHDSFSYVIQLALASASCDANSILNGTTASLRSRQSK